MVVPTPETGAHLTDTTVDKASPSLFEILSQENLANGLESAFHHLVKVLAYEQPQNFGWLYRNAEEVFLLMNAAIQYHYFETRGGTLSEAFYGIRRAYDFPTRNKVKQSLCLALLFPYAQRKLNKYVKRLKEQDESDLDGNLRMVLKSLEAVIKCATLTKFCNYLLYVVGKSRSHSILFYFLGWKLVYSNQNTQIGLQPSSSVSIYRKMLFAFGESVLPIVEFVSFMVQFSNWWWMEKGRETEVLPLPDPYESNFQLEKMKCPLCCQTPQNSTALSTTGIVYCYGCISKYMKQEQKCPVTGIRSSSENLVRIYH